MNLFYFIYCIYLVLPIFSKQTSFSNDPLHYGIIVDAGSTQTRLYIYQFHGPSNASYSPYVEPALLKDSGQQAKFIQEGSIAELKSKDMEEFFKGMINFAKDYIPKEKHRQTTFHVLATAGVRVLGFKKIKKVVNKVSEYLIQIKDFPFKIDEDFGVQVLPGEFEGAYDWLTINYLAGTLNKSAVKDSIISIDFGGASLELTFEPTERLSEGSFPLRVNGTDRILYTQSYLKFGRNQALIRHRQQLVENSWSEMENDTVKIEVIDPCFPINYRQKIKVEVFGKVRKVNFVGGGNYSLCEILTLDLLRKNVFCAAEPCGMNGKHQPNLPLNRPIFALDGFNKLGKILNCKGITNIHCLETSALNYCIDRKIEKVKDNNNNNNDNNNEILNINSKYNNNYSECFLAAYGINILKNGFNIDTFRQIHLTDDYHNINIGWTLGAIIYELEIMSFKKGYCEENINDKRNRVGIKNMYSPLKLDRLF
ncbi:nucleoside phosphatase GDA1/CD39 [Neoconidiobolus thromboides FSU 785]|nr:nucleoside phosphatase GDA1/CD39 [Neoconidiobolus thromboides FSU 785]